MVSTRDPSAWYGFGALATTICAIVARTSTSYDIERTCLNRLGISFPSNDGGSLERNGTPACRVDWREEMNKIGSACQSVLESYAHLQDTEGHNLEDGKSSQRQSRSLPICKTQVESNKYESVLWNLHWNRMPFQEGTSRHIGDRMLDFVTRPSSDALLCGWMALALALAIYHESRSNHRYRSIFLVGSVLLALLLGVVERSHLNTIILTNIPWCLTLGVATDMLVRTVLGIRTRRGKFEGKPSRQDYGAEKGTF
ncbi:hypothetical protein IQ07DRAFT_18780 [Pyrenochaeta sp. DS3sAY3a]|nr:hypothetical protein IQ07DRAFT_18780 [Pyrenochaeta sp. DS3sAY3a]